MKKSTRLMAMVLALILVLPLALAACGGESDEEGPQPTDTSASPSEFSTVIIGNLTDMTGVASSALSVMTMSLNDVVDYYNAGNLIPGVKVKVISYDGQYDPSKDIPGWEWLRERGADLIYTQVTSAVVTLKPVAESDKVVFFSATAGLDTLTPPGYLFSLGTIPQWEAWTLLKWIAENDWDYKNKGPAKIGGAAWEEPLAIQFFNAMEDYAHAHPEQFEFVGGYFAPFGTFTWGSEVQALKDADYVYPCTGCLVGFAKEYRNAGGRAKFIGDGPHSAFMGLVDDARAWGDIDGMLFVMATKWWNESGELIDLTRELLYKNHPDSAEKIMRSGSGYLASYVPYILLHIIADAAAAVGPENIDSQALYDAAESFSLTVDGVELYSFLDKRSVSSYYRVMEARESGKDLFSVSDWLPIAIEP